MQRFILVHGEGFMVMTQDERWITRYEEVVRFVKTNCRKLSRNIPEERNLRSWWKNTKKRMNFGELKADRVEMFMEQEVAEENKHVNQWK